MLTSKFLDDLATRIGDAIRASPAKDIEKNVRAALGSVFNKLDLVTRDEFEVQAQLLLRTRERLTQLEEKLRALEAAAGAPVSAAASGATPGTMPGEPKAP
jgi:BMFP domain-containing protein YqiC